MLRGYHIPNTINLLAGASITKKWSLNCSHVLVDDSFPLSDDLIDAIVARKPLVQYSWVEVFFV